MDRTARVWCMGLAALLVAAQGCDRFKAADEAPSAKLPATAQPATQPTTLTVAIPKTSESDMVARVNGIPITRRDFQRRLQEEKLQLQMAGVSWDDAPLDLRNQRKLQLLQELVNTELTARDHQARGALRDADTMATLWYVARSVLSQQWVERAQKTIQVSEDDVDAFYKDPQNAAIFMVPQRLRVRQIVVPSKVQATALVKQLLDGADFEALAKARSVAPDAATGGNLGWIVTRYHQELYARLGQPLEGAVLPVEAAESVVFTLDVGDFSQPVKGPGVAGAAEAYYLYQVVEKQDERKRRLTEVHDQLKDALAAQRLGQQIGELRNQAQLDVFEDRLANE